MIYLIPLVLVTIWPSWRALAVFILVLLGFAAAGFTTYEQPLALFATGIVVVSVRKFVFWMEKRRSQ